MERIGMKQYWVEGLLMAKAGTGRSKNSTAKPYSQSFWANSPQEAVQMALQEVPGARWLEGPTVSETSEEKRMRALGAPELPGLGFEPAKKPKKK
jgi:hypothetical protein